MAVDLGALFGRIEITGAQAAVRDLGRVSGGFTETGAAAGRAAGEVDRTEAALVGASRAAGLASQSQAKLRAMQLSVIAAQERYNAALADGNASEARLATTEASLLRANERLAVSQERTSAAFATGAMSMGAAETRVGGFGAAIGRAVVSMGKLGLGLGAFELARKAIDITKEAAAYNAAMTRVQTLTGTSAQEVQSLSKALLGMAGNVAQAPEDLATSMYHMKSIGLDAKDALNGVHIAAQGAAIGNANLEDTTNAMTAVLASGVTKGQDFSAVMSDILTIVGAGDMKLQDFNQSLGSGVLDVVAQYGVNLRDFGAAVAVFGDNNIRGAHSATIFRMAVQGLAVPMHQGEQTLNKLGLSMSSLAVDMQEGGLNKALIDLREHLAKAGVTGKQTGQVLTEIFGKRAGVGIAVLLGQFDRLQNKYKAEDDANKSFGARWKATTETAAFQMRRLGATIESGGISLAEKFMPKLADMAHWLGSNLPAAWHTFATAMAPVIHAIGDTFVSAWHVLLPVMRTAGDVLTGIANFLGSHGGLVGGFAKTVIALWAAWKGYTIATDAAIAIRGAIVGMALTAKAELGGMGSWFRNVGSMFGGLQSQSGRTVAIMRADMLALAQADLEVQVASEETAAVQADAAVVAATAYRDQVLAADQWSATMLADAENAVLAAETAAAAIQAQADATIAALAEMEAASTEAAAVVNTAGEEAAIGWGEVLGPIGLVVTALGAVAMAFLGSGDSANAAAANVETYTQAIEQDNNALGENLRRQVEHTLVQDKAYQTALRAGVGQQQLTDALIHGGSTLDDVTKKLTAWANTSKNTTLEADAQGNNLHTVYSKRAQDVLDLVKKLHDENSAVRTSARNARDVAAANKGHADSTKKTSDATQKQAEQTKKLNEQLRKLGIDTSFTTGKENAFTFTIGGVNLALRGQVTAMNLLSAAFDKFSGNANAAAEAELAVKDGIHGLNDQAKQYGRSLDENTAKGRSNLEYFHQQVDLWNQAAQAQIKNKASLTQVTSRLAENERAFRKHAVMLGYDGKEIDKLIAKYAMTPGKVVTYMLAHTDDAKTSVGQLNHLINAVKQDKVPGLTADNGPGKKIVAELQDKIDAIVQHDKVLLDANNTPLKDKVKAAQDVVDAIKQHNIPGLKAGTDEFNKQLAAAEARLNSLKDKQLNLYINAHWYGMIYHPPGGGQAIPAAQGTGNGVLPQGLSSVGEEGPELAYTTPRGTAIMSNPDSKKFLALTGIRAKGFNGGGVRGFAKGTASVMSVIRGAGFRGEAADIMYGIVGAESGFDATQHNDTPPDNSYGLAQINMIGSLGPARRRAYHLKSNNDLYNPATNLRVAYALSGHGQNFHPWSTYNSGAYLKYMSDSEGAHVHHGGHGGSGGSAAQSANQRRASAVGSASTAISGVNGIAAGPRFSMSTFNNNAFKAQVQHAKDAIDVARAAGASSETLKKLRDRLHDIEKAGERMERALKKHVADQIDNLTKVVSDPTQGSFASAIKSINDGLRRTGASAKTLDNVTAAEKRLYTTRMSLLSATKQLSNMQQYKSGIVSTLRGGFNAGQYGSIQDLEAGLSGATGSARSFRDQARALRHLGLDKKFAAQLIQAGPSASLATLANANPAQIREINREISRYRKTLGSAGDAAVLQRFGISIPGEQKRVDHLKDQAERQVHAISRLAHAVNSLAHHKATITIDGKEIGEAAVHSSAMVHLVDELANHLTYRRGRHG